MLSIIVPCYNESNTLRTCIEAVVRVAWGEIPIEILIVDDGSRDQSREIAKELMESYPCVRLICHQKNQGKGAAIRTGISEVRGDFVAIQDADLEYSPKDLRRLLEPLLSGDADVVIGSRFLSSEPHRVLHFWHSMGNKCLTLLSNMFTDMNLTDMETCYKVFRREVIQSISLTENRFGFEPEIVAKVADLRCRVYEMGVSYRGRTFEEGKKIGWKDGIRAVYCIVRYNAHKASVPVQFLFYLLIGGTCAISNFILFAFLIYMGISVFSSAIAAFLLAAILNYWLCIKTMFRSGVRWSPGREFGLYWVVVLIVALFDARLTILGIDLGLAPWTSKVMATFLSLVGNFVGRRFLVFPEKGRLHWSKSSGHS
jgi:dolichol-phosphate mannosyltransferase